MLLVPGWSEEFPDSVERGCRFAWQISLKFNAHIVAALAAATRPVDPSARVRGSIAVMTQNAPGGTTG